MYWNATHISDKLGQHPKRKVQRKQKPLGLLPKGSPSCSKKRLNALKMVEQRGVEERLRQEGIDMAIAKQPYAATVLPTYQRLIDKFAKLHNLNVLVGETLGWFHRLLNKVSNKPVGNLVAQQNTRVSRTKNALTGNTSRGT